ASDLTLLPCRLLPQCAVGAHPPVGVAGVLGDGDGLEARHEFDQLRRHVGPAAGEGEALEVVGGEAGPAPVGPELLGLLPVVPVVPRLGALLDGGRDAPEVEHEEGGHVLRLVVEAAEAEGGVLGEQAERLGAGAEVGVAALGGGLAGLDDAAHPGSRGWGTEKATAWRAKKAETRHFARPVQPALSGPPSRTRGRPRRPASGVGPIRPVRARSPCPLSPTAPAAPSSARSASAPSPRPSPSPPSRRRWSRSRSATPTRPSRRHLPRARCFA